MITVMLFVILCGCSGEAINKTALITTSENMDYTSEEKISINDVTEITNEKQEEKLSFIKLDITVMQNQLKKALGIKNNTKITPIKQHDYYNIHRYTISSENSDNINLSFAKNWLIVDISNGDVIDKPLASDYSYEKIGTIQDFYKDELENNSVKILEPQLKKFFKTESEYEHFDNDGIESAYEFSIDNNIYFIFYDYTDEEYKSIYIKENDNLKYFK